MDHKKDIAVLILRFIFGAILGGLLTIMMVMIAIWLLELEIINWIIVIGGLVTLLMAISATIWGDRFLIGFMKIFKIFKYF
jgi:uncharacterized membrane protein YoaK (UPF0700 family)